MPAMDEKKRKFLKHLGIIAVGGVLGMGLTKISAKSTDEVVNSYGDQLIEDREKIVWDKYSDYNPDYAENMADYDEYLVRVNQGQTLPVLKTGYPVVQEHVCAYDLTDSSGERHIEVYCTAPCQRICPVDAIKMKDFDDPDDSPEIKKVPNFKGKSSEKTYGYNSDCIGCGKCFKVCGYNAIQWINRRD